MVADDPRTGNLRSQQDLEKSIKMLQRYGGLPETGKLDAATIKLMGESRCGVSDFGKTDNTRRKKRYTLQGSRWKKHVSVSRALSIQGYFNPNFSSTIFIEGHLGIHKCS